MSTQADAGSSLLDLRTVLRTPERLLWTLYCAGARLARDTGAVLAGIQAIPRLVVALERVAPAADSLAQLAETRAVLDELARNTRHVAPTLGQLRALHEQVVEIACDLRALEPDIEELAKTSAALQESTRLLANAIGSLQTSADTVDWVPDRRRRASGPRPVD